MKELLKNYQEITTLIFEKFGLSNQYGEIDIRLESKWCLNGNEEIKWLENDEVYCNEIVRGEPVYYENYMMVYVDNGCGDQYWQIFDTNLQDDEIEEYE